MVLFCIHGTLEHQIESIKRDGLVGNYERVWFKLADDLKKKYRIFHLQKFP